MSGLILIDRAMINHHIVGIKNPLRFAAWCWMLGAARWKPGQYFHHGHEISLEIGQFACAREYMADKTGMTQKQVRTFLTVLERAEMVTKTVHQKGQGISIITICKYAEYQDFSKYHEMKGPAKGPAKGQGGARVGPHRETPEETPEETQVYKKEAKASQKKRAARLSENWFLPDEWGRWAVDEFGMSEKSIRFEADQFRDYWIGVGGQKGAKLNWQATWRNWIRRSSNGNGNYNGSKANHQTAGPKFDAAKDRALRLAGLR